MFTLNQMMDFLLIYRGGITFLKCLLSDGSVAFPHILSMCHEVSTLRLELASKRM